MDDERFDERWTQQTGEPAEPDRRWVPRQSLGTWKTRKRKKAESGNAILWKGLLIMARDKRNWREATQERGRERGKGRAQLASAKVEQHRHLVRREEFSVQKEVQYIIARAREGDSRVVSLRSLVFFSTASGDAWLLDAEDQLALPLVRDGEEQPYQIAETSTQFAIEWQADFSWDGDIFVVRDRAGAIRRIAGYPAAEIRQALQSAM